MATARLRLIMMTGLLVDMIVASPIAGTPKMQRVCHVMTTEPGPEPETLKNLFWMHIPKTGTSLGNTVYRYACPRLPIDAEIPKIIDTKISAKGKVIKIRKMQQFLTRYSPKEYCDDGALIPLEKNEKDARIAGHKPLIKRYAASGTGVVMLRSPYSRLKSAYVYLHANGIDPKLFDSLHTEVKTFEDYVAFSAIPSCATKMTLGHYCGGTLAITPELMIQALGHLHQAFTFVGITDYWDVSICLFHAQFGGAQHQSSFVNVRETAARIKNSGDAGLRKQEVSNGDNAGKYSQDDGDKWDPADTILFQAGLRIFRKRLVRFNLVPSPTFVDDLRIKSLQSLCKATANDLYCDNTLQEYFNAHFSTPALPNTSTL